jgi:hypothetical protein
VLTQKSIPGNFLSLIKPLQSCRVPLKQEMDRAFAGPRRVGGKTKLSSKRTVVNEKSDGGLYVRSQKSSSDVIFEHDPPV